MAERKKKKYSNCTYTTGNLSLNMNQFNKDAVLPDDDSNKEVNVDTTTPTTTSETTTTPSTGDGGNGGMAEGLNEATAYSNAVHVQGDFEIPDEVKILDQKQIEDALIGLEIEEEFKVGYVRPLYLYKELVDLFKIVKTTELVGYTGIDYIEARADLDNNRDARLAVAKKVAQLDNDKGTHLDYQPGANREGDFSADYYSVGKLVQRDDKVNKTTDFRTILFYPTIGSKPRVCYWFKLTIKGQEWPNFKQIGRDQLVQLVLSTAEKLDKKSNRWNMEKLKRKVLDEIAKDEQTISAVEFDQEDNLETRSKLDKGGVIAKPRVRALYSNQIYYLSTKNVTYGAPVVKYIKEDLDQDLEEKRETKRYYIRPQNIFCANKKDVLKALIDVADAGENCSVYTLKNLDDHDDVQKLSNDDIIYTYDEHALRDKNGVLVMDYDLFIKHEEERPKLGKSPDQITKSEFDQNYDDRMTQNTFVESKEDNMEDLVGKKVTIISIDPNDPAADDYAGKEGTITEVGKDPWGDIYYRGTWGGIALYPKVDKLKITEGFEVKYEDPFNLSFDTYEGDRKLFEDANEEQICCICGEPYKGYGNNAEPYKHGYCCDECNLKFVIPARMQGLNSYYDKKDEDEE